MAHGGKCASALRITVRWKKTKDKEDIDKKKNTVCYENKTKGIQKNELYKKRKKRKKKTESRKDHGGHTDT